MSPASVRNGFWGVPHLDVPASEIARGSPISRKHLINILNFIHFTDGSLTAVYRHSVDQYAMAVRVRPLPCTGVDVICRWAVPDAGLEDVDPFYLDYLLVSDDVHRLWVKPETVETSAEGLRLRLPENGIRLAPSPCVWCRNPLLRATVFLNGISFPGRLLNYTADAFRIDIDFALSQNAHWIRLDAMAYVVLSDEKDTYYSGACRIDGELPSGRSSQLLLTVIADGGGRFKPKIYRSKRVTLHPAPDAVFQHPLSLRDYVLRVEDLSGSGFSVVMDAGLEELFVGLIIPGIRLDVSGECLVRCKGQVVNTCCTVREGAGHQVRFGIAILDIDVQEHMQLQKVVQQAGNPNAYMNGRLDLNALWRFFFESGFIYPEKYSALADRKHQIKKIYDALYLGQPNFARHFIYQKDGAILGHGALLRSYANAWMIHHHAALLAHSTRAGLSILDQIGQFINESHKLTAMHMDYIFMFYRPDNKFPHRVFGESARHAGDPSKSSLDQFAYGHFSQRDTGSRNLPQGWELVDAHLDDLLSLKVFYDSRSGGLMISAFDLMPDGEGFDELSMEYGRIGLTRRRQLFALRRESRLKVFFEVNLADNGMNMSDLMNCVRSFLVDTDDLNTEILAAALARLADHFVGGKMPVMAFPAEASALLPFTGSRRYVLWIMNLQHTDTYFAFVHRLARFLGPAERHPATGS
ncbi:MAG: hypothetical protein ABIL58_20790 [Pseudomonadota bacterium]